MGTSVEVDRRQDAVDKSTEAPPAWPLVIAALYLFYIDAGASPCVEFFSPALGRSNRISSRERSDSLDRQRWLGRPSEQRRALRFPRSIILLARRCRGSIRIYLEDALLPKPDVVLLVELEHRRIPPHHPMFSGRGAM